MTLIRRICRDSKAKRFAKSATLKNNHKPALLILSSSFPSSPDDETCGYIRDFARSMSTNFDVRVLAPPDKCSTDWPADVFTLTRLVSLLPSSLDGFEASRDLNHLAKASLVARLLSLPSVLRFFCRALAMSLRADVICSHWLVPSGLVGSIASRFLRKPHITVEHSGALHFLARSRVGRSIARFVIRGSDRVVVVSDDLKAKLLKLCPSATDKIEVMPMGIFAERSFAIGQLHCTEQSPDPCKGVPPWATLLARPVRLPLKGGHGGPPLQAYYRTLLFVGRLVEIKGLDLLLTALNGMRDVRLVVAGDGEKRGELEQLASESSVSATFVGRVGAHRREELFASSDVVVIPSRVLAGGRTEGTPVVCLEAMLAGRVVVAARTGGLADVIVDGQNGLLFEPGDHLMLRQKLILALGDEDLRRRVSANARLTAQAFDWSRIGERFSHIIENAIEEHGHARDSRIAAGDLCG